MTARKRTCLLTHSYYDEDARARREADSLVAAGWDVDVYALRRPGDEPRARLGGVDVHRLPVQRHQGAGIATYLAEYLQFFALAGLAATRNQPRRRYSVFQVHNLPDFLVFSGLPLRLTGVPVVVDLKEAMPEFFRSRFSPVAARFAYPLLLFQERLAVAAVDAVVTVNEALASRLRALGVPADKITVVLNSPDLTFFNPDAAPARPFMADGVLRLVYAGAVTPMYELEVAVRAVALLRTERPDLGVELDVYGRGDSQERLRDLSASLGVAPCVRLHGRIPLEEVPAAIAAADIGLAPTRRDPFLEMSLSTKVFEYAAMGKPVIASRLPMVEHYFGPGTVTTYEAGDPKALAEAILRVAVDAADRRARIERTRARVVELSWEHEGRRYVDLIERLAAARA